MTDALAPILIFPALDFRKPRANAPKGEPIPIHRDWRAQYRKAREARAAFRDSFKLPEGPQPTPNHFTITDLTDDVCHWPVTDGTPFLFCGEASGGATYCCAHAEQAFRRPLSFRERKSFRMPI